MWREEQDEVKAKPKLHGRYEWNFSAVRITDLRGERKDPKIGGGWGKWTRTLTARSITHRASCMAPWVPVCMAVCNSAQCLSFMENKKRGVGGGHRACKGTAKSWGGRARFASGRGGANKNRNTLLAS